MWKTTGLIFNNLKIAIAVDLYKSLKDIKDWKRYKTYLSKEAKQYTVRQTYKNNDDKVTNRWR